MLRVRIVLVMLIFVLVVSRSPAYASITGFAGIAAIAGSNLAIVAALMAWLVGLPRRMGPAGPEDEVIDARIVYPEGSWVPVKVLVRRHGGRDVAYEPSVTAAPGGRLDLGTYQRRR